MKNPLLAFSVLLWCTMSASSQNVVTVSGDITSNTTWTSNNIYLLSGFVYVTNNAELTISPGTVIKGDKASKGTLIITRGSKILADGTASQPIVFTSNEPAGSRTYGDWGGLIILGRAPLNDPAGEKLIEGGLDPVKGLYGGTLPGDNSGILRYVRIEFPGIAFMPNNEINGLTLGSVGNSTLIDYVMVSYSGDDSYECFGGTVNAKHLIAYRGLDDDFDTDYGFNGRMQFLVGLRDSAVADISGSNGFESDNDASGTLNTPFTNAKYSNVTLIGPITGGGNTYNSNYKRGAHIRRSSKSCIYNSAVAGYPTGLLVDGANCEANATADELQVRNSVWAGCTTPLAVASGSTFDISTWYGTSAYGNSLLAAPTDLQLTAPYNYSAPNFIPQSGSPLLSGADFSAQNLQDPFFDVVTYKGAFGNSDWTAGWANYDCQNSSYSVGIRELMILSAANIYPNPVNNESVLEAAFTERFTGQIRLYDVQGRMVADLGTYDLAPGKHHISLSSVSLLPAGAYHLVISSEEGIKTVKLLK
ncbi:MAG: hypothetical protein RL213_761 [Bacteroidota bacterium]|jgi:hypothetical protein